jgi:hypothetical protein
MSAWNNSAPSGRIFMKFCIWIFSENLWRKYKFHWNHTRNAGTVHEDQCTFLISLALRMKNVADKRCTENRNTHFMWSNFFFRKHARYEIKWKDVERGRPQRTIWRVRIGCWILRATNTHTGCVIVTAFLLQQWLHEGSLMLRRTYIACPLEC